MPTIYCVRCGLAGHSKCPHCRSVFTWDKVKVPGCDWPNEEVPIGMIDSVLSHRLNVSEDKIEFKVYSKNQEPETAEEAFVALWDLMRAIPNAKLARMLVCRHQWEFAPFQGSDNQICGHRAPEKPLLDFMSDAWFNLTHGVRYSPKGTFCSICQKPDQWCEHIREPEAEVTPSDLEAAQIIHEALDAIEAGVEWAYERKEKA